MKGRNMPLVIAAIGVILLPFPMIRSNNGFIALRPQKRAGFVGLMQTPPVSAGRSVQPCSDHVACMHVGKCWQIVVAHKRSCHHADQQR